VKKNLLILIILLCLILTACNFPLWSAGQQNTTPQSSFRTQIPHNVNFPTRIPTISLQPSPPALGDLQNAYTYLSQSGDTLNSVARHFSVSPAQISYEGSYTFAQLLAPGTTLFIPKIITSFYYADILLPDSEVIYSLSLIHISEPTRPY
jgi:hypothetical protein